MKTPSPDLLPSAACAPNGWMRYVIVIAWCAILAGCVLRFSQLSTRVLFVDEAITQIRVAGHTYSEMNAELFDGRARKVEALQSYAQVDGGASVRKVVASLAKEDTQHPPLFYMAELAIVRVFGNSLFVWRLLPAIFGALSIAAGYALARELFPDGQVPVLAAAIMAVSPIERIYSEQAREYSLFVLLMLVSTIAVVRAFRTNTLRWWMVYAVFVAAGLYASPFMVYMVAAHAVFAFGASRRTGWSVRVRFSGSVIAAFAAYGPWIYELATHRGTIVAENSWSATRWPATQLAAKWIFNSGSAFFDLEYLNLRWGIVLALVAVVVAIAMWRGFREADAFARWCLGAAIAIPALLLVAPDLLLGEHRSAVARYSLPIFALLPLIVARGVRGRPAMATIVLAAGFCACAVGSVHTSWWDNDANADDANIAAAIMRESHAQVVSTIAPPVFVTVARLLRDDVRVSLTPTPATAEFVRSRPLFVLDPSPNDLVAMRIRTGLRFAEVPYARTVTAREIGAQLANPGQAFQMEGPGLYEGLREAALSRRPI